MADTFFFLKLEGIEGESQDSNHSGWTDALPFSEGIRNAGSYDAGTGGNTGQASFSEPIPESLSLNFAGIEYDYAQQSNTGDVVGITHFG